MLDGDFQGTSVGVHASQQGSEGMDDASKGDASHGEVSQVGTDGLGGEGRLLRKLANDVDLGRLDFGAYRNVVSLVPTGNAGVAHGVHDQSSSDLQPNGLVEA